MDKKSVLISSHHHKELKKLSEAFGLSYYRLVEEMILYFKTTGINPREPKNENPSKALRELDKRMVSFLKVQERDILKPLRQEVYNYSKEQKEEMKNTNTLLIKALNTINQNGVERTNAIRAELAKQQKALVSIAKIIDSKNKAGLLSKINTIFD